MTRLNVLLKLLTFFSYSFDHDGSSIDSIIMLVVVICLRSLIMAFCFFCGIVVFFIWSVVIVWIILLFYFYFYFYCYCYCRLVSMKIWMEVLDFFSWISMKLWARKSSKRIGDFLVLLLSLRALMFERSLSAQKDANFKSYLLGRV